MMRILLAVVMGLSACTMHAAPETHVRGALVWAADKQTLTECNSGRVYWVRVLAANPHFHLSKKVEKLNSTGTGIIVAEFRGEVTTGKPSFGPSYPVDGTLNVDQVISVEKGSCGQ